MNLRYLAIALASLTLLSSLAIVCDSKPKDKIKTTTAASTATYTEPRLSPRASRFRSWEEVRLSRNQIIDKLNKPTVAPNRTTRRSPAPHRTRNVKNHQNATPSTCGSNWRSTLSSAEAWIIKRESDFSTTDPNPNSTAFGLGQLLYGNRARFAKRLGVSPGTTDPCAQLSMFRMYVRERYGNAEAARAFWRSHSWY